MEQLMESWKGKVRRAVNRHQSGRPDWPCVKRLLVAAATAGSASEVINSTAALHSAVACYARCKNFRAEHADLVRFLLAAGAAIDTRDGSGMTPLLTAANSTNLLADNKTEILQLLLSAGASIHDRSPDGRTALHFAAQSGCADAVQLLLQAGAGESIQHASSAGHTALHYAAQSGCTDAVRMLLKAGADVAAVDTDGLTPLSCAVLHPRCAGAAADAPGLFAALFAAGAAHTEINARNSDGANALHLAVSGRYASAGVLALVSAGVDMNAANRFGCTPLHYAVSRDMAVTVTDLLSAGAAPDIPDLRGKTALSWAASRAAKYPSWSPDHPWVHTFRAFMEHHSKAPFSAAALVAAAAAAAKPSRRGRIETPAELQNQRKVVKQLLLAAVEQGLTAARAALQQHWPESREEAVLLTGVMLDVWTADVVELEAGLSAMQQMVLRVAAERADTIAAQEQDLATRTAALQLS